MHTIAEILDIHFDPKFGSAYWLELEKKLGLNVRSEITSRADFHLLGPMDVEALRNRPLLDFVPKRLHQRLPEMILAETGGTSGAPCRRVYLPDDFSAAFLEPWARAVEARDFPKDGCWLFVGPSGPHVIGQAARAMARRVGSMEPFAVDCDVRWFKRQGANSLGFRLYLDHVLSQAMNIIERQDIDVLFITPPLLLALAERMTIRQREAIRGIHLGGMMAKSEELVAMADLFANAVILPGYGNSMLGVMFENSTRKPGDQPTYLVDDPALWIQLVPGSGQREKADVDLRQTVESGACGRVVAHRLDPSFLLLNMVERDTACYATDDTVPAHLQAITEVTPVGTANIHKSEGVY